MSAQGNIIRYITTMVIVGLAVLTATTFYNTWKEIGQVVSADARVLDYFERNSGPDCRFKGTWHDWERDEWMTLGCLEVNGDHRVGSYSSVTGPRAISQVSMHWLVPRGTMRAADTIGPGLASFLPRFQHEAASVDGLETVHGVVLTYTDCRHRKCLAWPHRTAGSTPCISNQLFR